jgi:hypothetical protein
MGRRGPKDSEKMMNPPTPAPTLESGGTGAVSPAVVEKIEKGRRQASDMLY